MIVAQVRRTLLQRGLLEPGERVLVACSGGPDSAALLAALQRLAPELQLRLDAASVDHGLRPDAAADVALARAQAEALGVPFHSLRVEVPRDGSLQAAAREARYAALLGRMAELGAGRLAVGHTRDDQAETVLLRVLRGSGLRGLGGIQPRRQDGVIHPLLDCARQDVHRFAASLALPLADDPSNRDPRHARVRVRHSVVPVLQAEDPALSEHLADLADDARAASEELDRSALALLASAGDGPERLRISSLREATPSLRRAAMQRWLGAAGDPGPGRAQLEQLEAALSGRGEVWLSGGRHVRAQDGWLWLGRS
jgi:tRNA(Ile)-lysidine synthase